MGVVGLHHAVYAVDVFEEEREQGRVVLFRQQHVGLVELPDVIGPVVGRKGDACEHDLCAAGLEGADDLVEIGACVFNAETAETVIATELYDDDCRLQGDDAVDAFDAILGGVAADALVDDPVFVTLCVEIGLEVVGVAFAGVCA